MGVVDSGENYIEDLVESLGEELPDVVIRALMRERTELIEYVRKLGGEWPPKRGRVILATFQARLKEMWR